MYDEAEHPAHSEHDVILYGADDAALVDKLLSFFGDSVECGGAALIISTAAHQRALRSALSARGLLEDNPAVRERLVFLDAHEMLESLMVDGRVDRARFLQIVGGVVRPLAAQFGLSAYGEMVGILRTDDKIESAVQLECHWNELLGEVGFRLLCGYPIDVLSDEFNASAIDVIMCSHANLHSTLSQLGEVLQSGMRSILGEQGFPGPIAIGAVRRPRWAQLPEPESTILWLRENLPQHGKEIMQLAREHFAAAPPTDAAETNP